MAYRLRRDFRRYVRSHRPRINMLARKRYQQNRDSVRRYVTRYNAEHREQRMWSTAKARAKRTHRAFDIAIRDIKIPEICPVLGIPLRRHGNGRHDDCPSLDCLIPSLGYIRGNVFVISMRANRIKNDATPVELDLISKWVRRGVLRASR
jgi:hypothetical protein